MLHALPMSVWVPSGYFLPLSCILFNGSWGEDRKHRPHQEKGVKDGWLAGGTDVSLPCNRSHNTKINK